jgi:hypothetical protein
MIIFGILIQIDTGMKMIIGVNDFIQTELEK